MARLFFMVLVALVLSQSAFAGCAENSYLRACSSCPFDASGKMDSSCYSAKRSEGTVCVSNIYPIMAAKYAAGECPALDQCIAELQSCTAQYSTGNDRADCQEGSTRICYVAADQCTKRAAIQCGEIERECPGSSGLIMVTVFGALAFAFASRK